MAKELPYFKFEPQEWSSGMIQLCSLEAKGIFMEICCLYWTRLGDLPYAFALHKLCNGNTKLLEELEKNGIYDMDNDNIVIKFLDEQLNEFQETSEKRSKAANKRWKNASAMQVQSKSNAIREDKKKEDKKKEDKREVVIFPFNSENFKKQWNVWKKYKSDQFNFKYKSEATEQAALSSLSKLATNEFDAIEIIHESIANGWKGFFELKNKKNGKSGNSEMQEKFRAYKSQFDT